MKKAQAFAAPPQSKSEQAYLAGLSRRFFRVIKDFDNAGHDPGLAHIPKVGDVLLRGGEAHQTKVLVGTPTASTKYCLTGHGLMHEYEAQGYVRCLDLQELLSIIPHMTNRIWHLAGQFELRDMLCAMEPWRFCENPVKEQIIKEYFTGHP